MLDALIAEVKDRLKGKPRGASTRSLTRHQDGEVKRVAQSVDAPADPEHEPLSPYRVIWDLMHTVDLSNTIITP